MPPDTTIIYPIPLYHENPDFFSEPEKFDLTRFSSNKIKDIMPNTYCPFGFGARICSAKKIAMVDVKMMVCLMMQRFNVELAMKLEDVLKEERFIVMAKMVEAFWFLHSKIKNDMKTYCSFRKKYIYH